MDKISVPGPATVCKSSITLSLCFVWQSNTMSTTKARSVRSVASEKTMYEYILVACLEQSDRRKAKNVAAVARSYIC